MHSHLFLVPRASQLLQVEKQTANIISHRSVYATQLMIKFRSFPKYIANVRNSLVKHLSSDAHSCSKRGDCQEERSTDSRPVRITYYVPLGILAPSSSLLGPAFAKLWRQRATTGCAWRVLASGLVTTKNGHLGA